MIVVEQTATGDPMAFSVTVREGASETRHQVTMGQTTYHRLTGGKVSPADCVQAAFHFLLEREAKESILARFDITVIARYFPTFERDLPHYLARARED